MQNPSKFASFPFAASCEITASEWPNTKVKARTTTLSHHGCGIDASLPLASGAVVLLSIQRDNERFTCVGTIVHSITGYGASVQFQFTLEEHRARLHRWLAEVAEVEVAD